MRRANPAGVASRSLRLCAAALAIAAGSASAARAPPRARIVSVRIGGDAEAALVEIASDRPVSFTTLRLQAPPRVVIDFAEAELSGVPPEQQVEDGTVRRVGAAAAGARTARVIVELAFEAEFDVQARAAQVEVRVARLRPLPPPALVAAPGGPPAPAEAPPPGTALASAEVPPASAGAPAAPAGVPAAPAEVPAASSGAPPAPSEAARAAAEAQRDDEVRAALPTVALAGQEPAQELSADAPEVLPAPPPDRAEGRGAAGAARPSGAANIRAIGFRPQGAGAVVVRADRPLEVGVERSDSALLLHFASASIPLANNRRPLETSVFGGPVQRIVPLPGRGGTDVRIELRENAAYALQQDGGVLTVTFNR